jgi:hypothetical protein
VTVTRHGVRSRLAEGIGKYNFGIISYINRWWKMNREIR